MNNAWNSSFQSALAINPQLSNAADAIYQKYARAFPENYLETHDMRRVIHDICKIESINEDTPLAVDLYEVKLENSVETKVVIYKFNEVVALSDILPILQHLGFKTLREESYQLNIEKNTLYLIELNIIQSQASKYNIADIKEKLESALIDILANGAENDAFNQLVTVANMDISTVDIIRCYVKYLNQIKYRYSQNYIERTVCNHVDITELLIRFFHALHHPTIYNFDEANDIEAQVNKKLEEVKNIDDDNIIRRLLLLIKATIRTNYFQQDANGKHKSYITMKIQSCDIPDLPLPKPMIDTFVYSSQFEGIHLRCNKVSRGGIRWSDRHDDYRTEVLGLMKAQKVKNSIIIPSGAKGGFVIKDKALAKHTDMKKCIIHCYQQFIRGLLDVTDNIVNQEVVHPQNTVCHDGSDTYFVVAADKGTADLSDYANSISSEYAFWLGDAFASGGSNGYDHKKMGITAKGAWESLKRHLQEIRKEDCEFTMVGIGDMSGDVFGNGLIISDKVKLVAAFDNRHIFIDPTPDTSKSYNERVRLFQQKISSWADYNKDVISQGGGVYARSDKLIMLSNEAKTVLGTDETTLTPDQLIKVILQAPVDVLYNGGIGIYVKSSKETSENLGDKYNEFCRINGKDLRCKIVCEGGNLGLTQLARVEYSLNGGLINTDFIDNSAGVDCSDHEVNIKILLINALQSGKLNMTERTQLLYSMESEVFKKVIHDNYCQALLMSTSSFHANNYFDLYHEQMKVLEEKAGLDRVIESLPSEEEVNNRKSNNKSLTRPELAVLLAYTKIYIKNEIMQSSLTDSQFFNSYLLSIFPHQLIEKYSTEINNHILRREIIATQISNHMINNMGMTFPFRIMNETGASVSDIATAYTLSMKAFNAEDMFTKVQSLDKKISLELQYKLLHSIRVLINMSTRWFLQRKRIHSNLRETYEYFSNSIMQLKNVIPGLIRGNTKEFASQLNQQFASAGLDAHIVDTIIIARVLYTALNISDVSAMHNFELIKTAQLYFHVGGVFKLVWFRDFLANDSMPGSRSNRARLSLRDDLDSLQRRLTIAIMQSDPTVDDIQTLTNNWLDDNKTIMNRWSSIFTDFSNVTPGDYTSLFIAIRELSSMIDTPVKMERMSLLAYHDALTKLPNRLAINDKLEVMREKAEREQSAFALHFIDLDKFKSINDTYGHQIGDEVLLEVTKRLLTSIRSGDVAARLAGDEFIVLQSSVSKKDDALHLAKCILSIISKPMYLGEQRINLTASIGTSIYPLHGTKSLELMTKADKAMYESKSSPDNKVVVYNEDGV